MAIQNFFFSSKKTSEISVGGGGVGGGVGANNYVDRVTFDDTTGIITLERQGLAPLFTQTLDSRYRTSAQTLSWDGGSGQITILDGNTIDIDGRYALDVTGGYLKREGSSVLPSVGTGNDAIFRDTDTGNLFTQSLPAFAFDETAFNNVAYTNVNNNFSADQTFGTNVVVTGNLTVNGTTFTVNTATVEVEDNLLLINNGEIGAGVTAGLAGIEVDRGSSTNYQFLFDESDDRFKIGTAGSLQAVATRADSLTNRHLAQWNSSFNRFDGVAASALTVENALQLGGVIAASYALESYVDEKNVSDFGGFSNLLLRTGNSPLGVSAVNDFITIDGSGNLGKRTLATFAFDSTAFDDVAYKNVNNNFTTSQTVTGNLTATGTVTAPDLLINGAGIVQTPSLSVFHSITRNLTDSADRRNWSWASEQAVAGDFRLLRSTTNTGSASTVVLSFDKDGKSSFANNLSVSGTVTATQFNSNHKVISGNATYTQLFSPNGGIKYNIGNTASYIDQDNHFFRLINGAQKLEINSSGIVVTGTATATSFWGNGSELTSLDYNNIANAPTIPTALSDLTDDLEVLKRTGNTIGDFATVGNGNEVLFIDTVTSNIFRKTLQTFAFDATAFDDVAYVNINNGFSASQSITSTSTSLVNVLSIINDSTANNTTKSVGIDFKGFDTVGSLKIVGNISSYVDNGNILTGGLVFKVRTADVTNPSEVVRIDSSGNVGIGTASPRNKLQVEGNIEFGNWGTAGSRYIGYSRQDNGGFGLDGSSGIEIESGSFGGSGNYDQKLHIWTHTFNGGSGRRLTVDNSGNVGIGTTSPSAKLDVVGNAEINGNLTTTGTIGVASGEKVYWGSESESYIEGSSVSNNIKLGTGGINRLTITDALATFDVPTTIINGVLVVETSTNRMLRLDGDFTGGFTTKSIYRQGVEQWREVLFSDNSYGILSEGTGSIGTVLSIAQNGNTTINGNLTATGTVTATQFNSNHKVISGNATYTQLFSPNGGIKYNIGNTASYIDQDNHFFRLINGAQKLEINSSGIVVTGTATATSFSGDGSLITGVSADSLNGIGANNYARVDVISSFQQGVNISGAPLTVSGQDIITNAWIKTGAPSGGTAKKWKLGNRIVTDTVALDSTEYVQIEVEGHGAVKLAVVNSSGPI